ncbi:YCF48-related protein [Pseudomonas sp. 148P]|uniref:YCF48-related protein n=1 Tax=Pseudomonas ulcerans TaxID=3115852 RepID=A0ABU7HR33_9PSED|nr:MULTISPECIES: YCF48-related protein [unclassified Pseudomonas]MEE1923035.1 YCF48-related protein [Pseudomonas sp. 147P]MEE1933997.1 YCF48-related protein [Pseudomonas sp. 148P]
MRNLIGYLMSAIVIAAVAFAFAPRQPPAPASTGINADRVQVNALLADGPQLLGVGERGTILRSEDGGLTWQASQVAGGRAATLTAVAALGPGLLVAVGHDGWILRSTDGGLNWQEIRYDAELGEPLLGVWSSDGRHVVAYGSYGKYLESSDAGEHWTAREMPGDGAHFNGLDGGSDGRQMLVGEQGLVLRSADGGQHWQSLDAFYNGSLFGVVRLSAERWLAYGMRGHVFITRDFGDSWQRVDVGSNQPIYGHALLPGNQGLVLVGAGSRLIRLDAAGAVQDRSQRFGLGTLTSAVVLGARHLLVAGERGVYQGNDSGALAAAR